MNILRFLGFLKALLLVFCFTANSAFSHTFFSHNLYLPIADSSSKMIIYREDNDSVIYNPNPAKLDRSESKENTVSEMKINTEIDHLLKKVKDLEKKNQTKEVIVMLDSIANLYENQKNYKEAKKYYLKSIHKREETSDKRGIAKVLNNLAAAYFNSGEIDESIHTYQTAIKIRNDLKDKEEEASLLVELANIYQYSYKSDYAIEALEQSVKIKREINAKLGITSLINNIGNLYFENNKIDKAIEFYEQNLETEKKLNDKSNIAASYNNLGIAWFKKSDYSKAKNYFQQSWDLYKEISDKKGISSALNNLANISYNQKDYNKSLELYENSLKLKNEIHDEKGQAMLKHNIGNIYKEKKYYQKAKQQFEESSMLARRNNFTDVIAKNLLALAQLYSTINDYKNAYEHFKQYADTRQILDQEEKEIQLTERQEKYSIEKEIHRLQKRLTKQDLLVRITAERNKQMILIRDLELNRKEELVKKQTIFIVFAILILVLIISFSILIFRQIKKLKRSNTLLSSQKSEIDQKRKLLETTNEKLEEVNKQLEKLSIVASETVNGVVIMDKDGNFEWINEGFTRLYGFTLQTLIEKRGKSLISASANPNVRVAVMSCIKQKTSVRYETFFPDEQGKKIWAQTTLTPIMDHDNNIVKLVAIDSDITKIKTIEEEMIKQRDEIEKQRDQITKQRDFVMKQRDEISLQKEEITEGIIYSQHIQTAILPPFDYINERLPQHFIIYKPRDIVSGDFYWVRRIDHYIIFTAADCTGHGVPAALMSMMGSALLNEILNIYIKDESKVIKPSNILDELRAQVIKSLHQTGKTGTTNDGMDMSLCILDSNTMKLQYAGANSPLYFIPFKDSLPDRILPNSAIPFGNDLNGYEIKADKMPISIHMFADRPFTNHEIQLEKNDLIYVFSDGYMDQFGGPKYMKFSSKRFKKVLVEVSTENMETQQKILEDTLNQWREHMEQIDDILVFGVKI